MESIRVVAGIAVSGRKILIARRSQNKSLAGMWEFPGGKVESGEDDEGALAREIREEFDREISIGEKFLENNYSDSMQQIKLITYFISFKNFPKESNAHDLLKWSNIEDLPNYEFCPADREVVGALISHLN